ncbi:hypothetical protein ALI22I_46360 [Saccharothrix sp. ALI-22-I]|uniref:class I SAM-dependent methyltransferase n=1 Tax=Saccharothrix sp. ALI-22-I TaxID=1933778 RepID=UPI00097CAFAD|nr:hypothetical protein [Saccharothrix sp. ALI-22-I]ONI80683.1 hypothetical protein ALI22I_46360 [Saccharothrix sp. ALI-22-I]
MTDLGAELFDRVAADYDRSVPFFATFGHRLVEWVGLAPGARVLDLGAGRGAVTAAAVRAEGSVGCRVLRAGTQRGRRAVGGVRADRGRVRAPYP